MFNEISFINNWPWKKKSSIIPPSFFRKDNTQPKSKPTNTNTSVQTSEPVSINVKPSITQRKSSALSLKSIQEQKNFQANKKKVVITDNPEDLPKDQFTQEQLTKEWLDYGKRMDKKGERIVGSMLAMNKPVLRDDFELFLELPNESMTLDMEKVQQALLKHLKEVLNNYSLFLTISVNEEVSEKHAFTPQEKYNKLKEVNPLVDLLRQKLDLDI